MFDLNSFMRRMGWSQEKLAEKLSDDVYTCPQSKIGMWNTGKSYPRFNDLVKLIRLGMSPAEIFDENLAQVLMDNMNKEVGLVNVASKDFEESVTNIMKRAFAGIDFSKVKDDFA